MPIRGEKQETRYPSFSSEWAKSIKNGRVLSSLELGSEFVIISRFPLIDFDLFVCGLLWLLLLNGMFLRSA